ncbi:MAG: RNB domain-containing ribonuclease [Magnetococcales bacterium]|nr:RNB domain-containing ribonuclease [Magnetococcales bacterium]
MSETSGVVAFTPEGDRLALVVILDRSEGKARILNEKGREKNLNLARILCNSDRTLGERSGWSSLIGSIQAALETLVAEVDVPLLWESVEGGEGCEAKELADLFFGETDGMHQAAVWTAVVREKLHFQRQQMGFKPRDAEAIETFRQQRIREEEILRQRASIDALMKRLLGARKAGERIAGGGEQGLSWVEEEEPQWQPELPPEQIEFIENLYDWLFGGHRSKDVEKRLASAGQTLRLTDREAAVELLIRAGRLSPRCDRDRYALGVRSTFSQELQSVAEQVTPWGDAASEPEEILNFSIDDPQTREVDDALSVRQEGELHHVVIAIADAGRLYEPGSPIDQEAARRSTTVYLPTGTFLMVPEHLSCDLGSLTAGLTRSAMTFHAWLDADAQVQRFEIKRQGVRIAHRLSYTQADAILAGASDAEAGEDVVVTQVSEPLHTLHALAMKLRARRIAEGAVLLPRREMRVAVSGAEISVTMVDPETPSHHLVSEFMILANHLAADLARKESIPLIFRTQEAPLEPLPEGVESDPMLARDARRLLRPASLSLEPGTHHGLALSSYTQLTSPLRRYADLIMQRQFAAWLDGSDWPYDHERLMKVLASSESIARDSRKAENSAKRRWFLHWLESVAQQDVRESIDVMVVQEMRGGCRVETRPWGVDGFLATGAKITPGEVVKTRVERIQADVGNMRLTMV